MNATALDPRTSSAGRNETLPRLLDCKSLRSELGITRAAAEAIMRQLPVIEPPVPTDTTMASTSPPVSSQSSGPVVR